MKPESEQMEIDNEEQMRVDGFDFDFEYDQYKDSLSEAQFNEL